MSLLELQRRMGADVMRPLTARERMSPHTRADYIKPNDRNTAEERLEIYNRQYWFRILDSLCEDFPGLVAILGQRPFHRLSIAYLTDHPSRSFTMRNLGSRLPDWLAEHPQHAGKLKGLALDMARLEWAHIGAFDEAEAKPLGPEDLLVVGPRLKLTLQPHVRLLDLTYPVDELRLRVNDGKGVLARHRRPGEVFVAVHRFDDSIFYRRLEPGEYRILKRFAGGSTVAKAVAGAEVELLEGYFASWSELGWLCLPRPR
jgi:hypothetical protein